MEWIRRLLLVQGQWLKQGRSILPGDRHHSQYRIWNRVRPAASVECWVHLFNHADGPDLLASIYHVPRGLQFHT